MRTALKIIFTLSMFFVLGNVYGGCFYREGNRVCVFETSIRFNMGKCRETKTFKECEEEALKLALERSRILDTIVTVSYYNE